MSEDQVSSNHLVIGRTKYYGDLFKVLNSPASNTIEALEVYPVGQGGHFILEVMCPSAKEATQTFEGLKIEWKKQEIDFQELELFINLEDQIVDAYLSLNTPDELQGGLAVVEGESLIEVLKAAQRLIHGEARIFDLRFLKGSSPRAICIVTQVKSVPTISSGQMKQTFIPVLNQTTKDYFQSVKRLHKI